MSDKNIEFFHDIQIILDVPVYAMQMVGFMMPLMKREHLYTKYHLKANFFVFYILHRWMGVPFYLHLLWTHFQKNLHWKKWQQYSSSISI